MLRLTAVVWAISSPTAAVAPAASSLPPLWYQYPVRAQGLPRSAPSDHNDSTQSPTSPPQAAAPPPSEPPTSPASQGPATTTQPQPSPASSSARSRPVAPSAPPRSASSPPGARPPAGDTPPPDTRELEVRTPENAAKHHRRAATVVTRDQIDERQPRSTPDALRYEPGVYVQQTAHAQASPYVRGVTGQQTVMRFDGVRLNTSTFRQGPNQYFFLVDSRTVSRLEVLRGAASTRYGSDAIGGALLATPLDPTFGQPGQWRVKPRLMAASRTADDELGGRVQLDTSYGNRIGLLGGVGYRDVGQLETAGPIKSPATGEPHKSPAFESDVRTQRGTGFREFTGDARIVYRPDETLQLSLGYYDYRQKDAPRTDRCPADGAPEDSCLVYLDQFRTLIYAALELTDGAPAAEALRATVSYQRQHEHRFLFSDNPVPTIEGGIEHHGRDDVDTIGTGLVLNTARFELGRQSDLRIEYGGDAYFDRIDSQIWQLWTDVQPHLLLRASRGQYITDSRYLTSGAFAQGDAHLGPRVTLRGGGRMAFVAASSPGDAASSSRAVSKRWWAPVGNAGMIVAATPWLDLSAGADQGFRAPNLDDLTSRQQTGPGFQFENADLEPERALTLEIGARVVHPIVQFEAFGFRTSIDDLIGRAPRTTDECPDDEPGCTASQTRLQLINFVGPAYIWGADGSIRLNLPANLGLRATLSYAWGEGPNPVPPPPDDVQSNYRDRVPLSRVPPLNGTAEFGWRSPWGVWLAAVTRWATAQDRLAVSDTSDIRIPQGGTPGFAVFDVRVGYRANPWLTLATTVENVLDTSYRYHGSAVNGAGRSINLNVSVGW
ncbi:MAG: TonB-dependent receptor [Myxococcales bacterium FL481]|nr:MAG: TonB-dependent receptor [Myxococcales bacterium FL481]